MKDSSSCPSAGCTDVENVLRIGQCWLHGRSDCILSLAVPIQLLDLNMEDWLCTNLVVVLRCHHHAARRCTPCEGREEVCHARDSQNCDMHHG